MAYILLLRILDLLTTHLAFICYDAGTTIEANPVTAYFISLVGFRLYAFGNILLSTIALTYLLRFRLTRIAVYLFCVVNLIVVGINIYAIVA